MFEHADNHVFASENHDAVADDEGVRPTRQQRRRMVFSPLVTDVVTALCDDAPAWMLGDDGKPWGPNHPHGGVGGHIYEGGCAICRTDGREGVSAVVARVIDLLRSLPVEERMAAMGMERKRPGRAMDAANRWAAGERAKPAWVEAPMPFMSGVES